MDGRRLYAEVDGEWFRARLDPPSSTERMDPAGARRLVVKPPQLLCGVKDASGERIVLTNEMRLEVDSRQLGRATWEVVGDPTPIRKKRALIGWQAQLKLVTTHEAA